MTLPRRPRNPFREVPVVASDVSQGISEPPPEWRDIGTVEEKPAEAEGWADLWQREYWEPYKEVVLSSEDPNILSSLAALGVVTAPVTEFGKVIAQSIFPSFLISPERKKALDESKGKSLIDKAFAQRLAWEKFIGPELEIPFLPLFRFPWTPKDEDVRHWKIGGKEAAELFGELPIWMSLPIGKASKAVGVKPPGKLPQLAKVVPEERLLPAVIPEEKVIPEVVKPRGVEYKFNLAKFRFEPKPVEIPPGVTPEVDKLTSLVKSAKPARELTEALKTEELGKRVAEAASAARATGSSEAAFAAMAKLKGQMPTAVFTPPEAGLVKEEIASLFSQVKNKLLLEDAEFFKWLNTDASLRKLLGGNIPTRSELILLEDMFGVDLVKAILGKRPLSEKVWELSLDLLNIPRAILASGEWSAWFRQGAFVATTYPKIGAKALAVDFRTFFSGKYTAEIDLLLKDVGKKWGKKMDKLYVAPISEGVAVKLSAREEAFMSRFVKKIPVVGQVVRWSERAYLSTLNYMRVMTFDHYATKWAPMHYSQKTYNQLSTLINWSTGRGPIGKLDDMIPALNAVFFATRLQTSRVAMLFAGPTRFTSPPVRRAYARMMVSFFGSMGGIVALLGAGGLATIEKDPRSTDFGKIRVGNTRLDPWAGFKPYITLIAQLIAGQRRTATGRVQDIKRGETLMRFMRSKLSPAAGLWIDILSGETFLGEEMSIEAGGLGEQIRQRLMPLWYQDTMDAIKEEGWLGGFLAAPGALGVGVVTYPGSLDAYERQVKDLPEGMLMDWQRGVLLSSEVLTYRDLNTVQRSWVIRRSEEIGDVPERMESGNLSFYGAERKTREDFEVLLNEETQPLVDNLLSGEISPEDYIKQTDFIRNKYFGPAAHLWRESMLKYLEPKLSSNLDRWHQEEIKPEDEAYEKYMDIRGDPPSKAGIPDWDAWSENLKEFLSLQPPEIVKYIEVRRKSWIDSLPEDRQPVERLFFESEQGLDIYYSIAKEEQDLRLSFRDSHPRIDAKMTILGRVKSRNARTDESIRTLLQQFGVPDTLLIDYSSVFTGTQGFNPFRGGGGTGFTNPFK